MQSNSDPTHNLTSAFLFLRTASTAVTNLTTQISSTKSFIHSNSQNRRHRDHIGYEAQLEAESRDLEMWEARLVEAGVGFINWAVKVKTGRWLPGEILGMIGEELRKNNDLVLPPY